jgi:hypothetical protein
MRSFTFTLTILAAVGLSCQSEDQQEPTQTPQAQVPPPLQVVAPTLAEPEQAEPSAANTTPPPPPPTPLFPIDKGMNKQPASHGSGGSGKPSIPSVRPPINPNEIDTDTLPDSIKNKIPGKPTKPIRPAKPISPLELKKNAADSKTNKKKPK